MPKKKKKTTPRRLRATNPLPLDVARGAADAFIAAIVSDIPRDIAPGDVNLRHTYLQEIEFAITHFERAKHDERKEGEDYSLEFAREAGYLLGVQIGLRLRNGVES